MSIKEGSMERLVYIGEFRYIVEAWYSDDGGVHATVSEIRYADHPLFAAPGDGRDDIKRVLDEAVEWTKDRYGNSSCVEVTE